MFLRTVLCVLSPATAISSAAGKDQTKPQLPKFIAKWRNLFPTPAGYQQNVQCSTCVVHTWHTHGVAEYLLSNLVATNVFDARGSFSS